MTDWLVIGGSGHAGSVASTIRGRGDRVAGVSDSGLADAIRTTWNTGSLLEPFSSSNSAPPQIFAQDDEALDWALEHSYSITIGIGDNRTRWRVAEQILDDHQYEHLLGPLLSATATIDQTAQIGPLTQVMEHVHVGPRARIGSAVIVNTASIVEHEAVVGTSSHLAPASVLLGAAHVGNSVFVGSGARVLPGVRIGEAAVLGAGAVVTRNAMAGKTYVGIPARILHPKKGTS